MTHRFEIRRLRAEETDLLRRVRLASLADAPSAFGSDHATEERFPLSTWEQRTVDGATSEHTATFVATDARDAHGVAVGRFLDESPGVVELNAMWLTEGARGSGAAGDLVEAVVSWARSREAKAIELWVMRDNDPAAAFYRKCGFVEMPGFRSQLDDPCRDEQRMRLDLD